MPNAHGSTSFMWQSEALHRQSIGNFFPRRNNSFDYIELDYSTVFLLPNFQHTKKNNRITYTHHNSGWFISEHVKLNRIDSEGFWSHTLFQQLKHFCCCCWNQKLTQKRALVAINNQPDSYRWFVVFKLFLHGRLENQEEIFKLRQQRLYCILRIRKIRQSSDSIC